jgi:hypothetical protein
MTDGENRPTLSVVISTVQEPCGVIENFEDLRQQIRALNGQLIVVSRTRARVAPPSDDPANWKPR